MEVLQPIAMQLIFEILTAIGWKVVMSHTNYSDMQLLRNNWANVITALFWKLH